MSTDRHAPRVPNARIHRKIGWLTPLAAGAVLAAAATAAAAPQAHVEAGPINADILTGSTFGAQSFRLRNDGDVDIVKVTFDLGDTALFPDIVFDPDDGSPAGDQTMKDFEVDEFLGIDLNDPTVPVPLNLEPPEATYGSPNDDGFSSLMVEFDENHIDTNFSLLTPGTELKFSIDVDPTSIKGTNPGAGFGGAYPAGAVSGAELHGAKVTVEYSDGTVQTADLTRIDDGVSTTDLPSATAPIPTVAIASGVLGPVATPTAMQTLAVTGPANQAGVVLVAEGHLYLGPDFAGFDLDPFEANTAVKYTEYPVTFDADGNATVDVTLTNTPITDLDATLADSQTTGLNYITVWAPGAGSANGPVSDPLVIQLDPNASEPVPPGGTPVNPPPSPTGLITVGPGPLGEANCLNVAAPAPSTSSGGTIKLSVGQLQTNQRIGQAAIRRLNAIQQWLDAGIVDGDLCGGTLGPRELGGGLAQAPGAAPAAGPTAPRPLNIAKAAGSGKITLTPGQLRINQRIYRAALLRGRAINDRLAGKLTGGDLVDGTLAVGRFAVPLTSTATTAAAPAASTTAAVTLTDKGTPITLSAGQLRTNQKIAQQAVREANALRSRLAQGLLGTNFAEKSITSVDLSS